MHVRPKKYWGQHFLMDENIARKVVASLSPDTRQVVEIGPGRGVLTKYLIPRYPFLYVVEVDPESVSYITETYPALQERIIAGDFLKTDLRKLFTGPFSVIGNFPYNISSPILFQVLGLRDQVTEVVGMFQKEVAERIVAGPGTKTYGILSVLVKAFYDIEYLFTVSEQVFSPRPRVKSAVIRLKRNGVEHLDCDEDYFFRVVKTAFNQRRKTLRNALKSLLKTDFQDDPLLAKRAEQLSVQDFIRLTKQIKSYP